MGLINSIPVSPVNLIGWPWTIEYEPKVDELNKKLPKISIVTPTFNQGKFIEETIRSVLLQNYPNLEYIIIDGGSTDNTLEILRKYEKWITFWVSEPDKGQSHAINKGLRSCTGDIFNWLNSDDWYTPGTFYEVAKKFSQNPKIEVVSGFEIHVVESGKKEFFGGTFLCDQLEQTIEICQIAQPSTFFRLDVFKEIAPIPEDLHYLMDAEIWVRYLLLKGQNHFLKVAKPLVYFRLHKDSKTVNNSLIDNFLYERSSIIMDILFSVGLPKEIIDYWKTKVLKTSITYKLNRNWRINGNVTNLRKLRIYFIKKYITLQFMDGNIQRAYFGVKLLLDNKAYDKFLLKNICKLIIFKL
jgi:glycosyltransferase involved in cell wall biosynthesis